MSGYQVGFRSHECAKRRSFLSSFFQRLLVCGGHFLIFGRKLLSLALLKLDLNPVVIVACGSLCLISRSFDICSFVDFLGSVEDVGVKDVNLIYGIAICATSSHMASAITLDLTSTGEPRSDRFSISI